MKYQEGFKSDLREIKTGLNKLVNQQIKKAKKKKIADIFDLREKIMDYFRDNSILLSEAKYKVKYGEGLKILTPKQILQRLPTALARVKEGNNS